MPAERQGFLGNLHPVGNVFLALLCTRHRNIVAGILCRCRATGFPREFCIRVGKFVALEPHEEEVTLGEGVIQLSCVYIRSQHFPPTFTKNQRDSLRRKSKSFIIQENGLLHYRDKKKDIDLQVFTA